MNSSATIRKIEHVLCRRWKLGQFSRICVREIINTLNCDECAVIQISDENIAVLASKGLLGKREIKSSPALESFRDKKKSIITGNVADCTLLPGIPYGSFVNSIIWAPIIMNNMTAGILYAGSYARNAFSGADASFMEEMAADFATALHNFTPKSEGEILDKRTGAYSRELFNSDLTDILASSIQSFSLVMLTIDDFPRSIERPGSPAYNSLLENLVSLLTNDVRPMDRLYHYGKTEFVILLEEVKKPVAVAIAQRLTNLVGRTVFPAEEHGQQGYNITVSAGIVTYPDDASDNRGLIKSLQVAISQARQMGNNKICHFEITC